MVKPPRLLDGEGKRYSVNEMDILAVKLRAETDRAGDVRIPAALNVDVSGMLRLDHAPLNEPYVVRFRHELSPPCRGEVTLENTPADAG